MIRALWREGKSTLSDLLDALQDRTKDDLKVWLAGSSSARTFAEDADRATGSVLFMLAKAANLIQRSEEHTSELQSLMRISYAVFFLKKKHANEGRLRCAHNCTYICNFTRG